MSYEVMSCINRFTISVSADRLGDGYVFKKRVHAHKPGSDRPIIIPRTKHGHYLKRYAQPTFNIKLADLG